MNSSTGLQHMIAGVLATILLAAPALAQAPAGTLIVGNKDDDTLSFIDADTGRTLKVVATGNAPHEIAISPDGRTAVAVAYGDAISPGRELRVYDVESASETRAIPLGGHSRPHGLLWLGDGPQVIVTTEGSNSLLIVDINAGQIVKEMDTGQDGSHMVALTPDGARAFTANLRDATMSVFDLASGQRLAILEAEDGAEGIAVTTDGAEVWLASNETGKVTIYDTQTLQQKARIDAGPVPIRVAMHPGGVVAVTSNYEGSSLSVIDIASRQIIRRVGLVAETGPSGPVSLLFSPNGDRLYVAMPSANEVAIIDTASWTQLGTFDAGNQSDGLGLSPVAVTVAEE